MSARPVALAVFALGLAPALAEEPSAAIVQAALQQVGQVIASDCEGGGSRTGTAFVWPDAESAVTARHVVAGCQSLRVQFPGGPSLQARPDRELAERDLLILHLSGASGRVPLDLARAVPAVHAQVAVVGYALGAPTPDDKLLTVTAANAGQGAQLRDLLPARYLQQIAQTGPWRLDTAILRLDGNMVSGHSGAPLLAPDGTVAAIGAGGLQDGASGIVWAVLARYLTEPEGWQPVSTVRSLGRPEGFGFADQSPQAEVPTVACGAFSLARARVASLAELRQSTDDPQGLAQLVAALGPGVTDPDEFLFDVWIDAASGATIPVPSGAQLFPGPLGCMAAIAPDVGLNIVTQHLPDLPEAERQWRIETFSQTFEASFGVMFPQGLPSDPQFTYSAPLTRPDGFVANRKGFGGPQWVAPGALALNYVFLSHVARGRDYAGVSAIRFNRVVPEALVSGCIAGGDGAACRALDPGSSWARAALAVHMTTIPPI